MEEKLNILTKTKINYDNRYRKADYKKGEMFPIISDVMFKTMISNESRKKYVCYLLSLALKLDYNEIFENIIFIKEELDNANINNSKKTVDFICKINDEYYNIEMNNNPDVSSLERNISYINNLYSGSMRRGDKNYHYNKTIQININNFYFNENEVEMDEFYLQSKDNKILTDKIRIIYIYLPIIRKKYYNKCELTDLEKLLLVFNEKDSDELNNIIKGDCIMEEYRKEACKASRDEEIIGLYDKELDDERVEKIRLDYAREDGKKTGIIEGKKKVALNLLKQNVSEELILTCTGLNKEELNDLKKEL